MTEATHSYVRAGSAAEGIAGLPAGQWVSQPPQRRVLSWFSRSSRLRRPPRRSPPPHRSLNWPTRYGLCQRCRRASGPPIKCEGALSADVSSAGVGGTPTPDAQASIPIASEVWSNSTNATCASQQLGTASFASPVNAQAWHAIGLLDTPAHQPAHRLRRWRGGLRRRRIGPYCHRCVAPHARPRDTRRTTPGGHHRYLHD
jgi:hypothetical protein